MSSGRRFWFIWSRPCRWTAPTRSRTTGRFATSLPSTARPWPNGPSCLVITKMDVTGASESRERITRELCRDAVAISAVTGQGIPQLIHRIVAMLEPPEVQDPPTEPPAAAGPGRGRVNFGRLSRDSFRGRPGK